VGINLLLNTGATRSVLTGVARGLGIDGLIAAVPAVAGKQPGAGLFAQMSPVGAEFVEQDRTEHHVAVLATLAALYVNHHPLAIDVGNLQVSQLSAANSAAVERHQ
jgi:hypothetical protein